MSLTMCFASVSAASCLVTGLGGEMMQQKSRSAAPAPARRPEPSWPTVIATTLRLWIERHPVRGLGRRAAVTLAVVGVVALAAGVAGAAIWDTAAPATPARMPSPSSRPAPGAAAGLEVSAATRDQAAEWVAGQVAPSAIVACDPAMCAALAADGIPAARLLALGAEAADPLGSDLVVATPAVRDQFGPRLDSVYAPVVIARFGSGAGQIDIRAIAPDGAAAYSSALTADLRGRISAGGQLLRNRRLTLSPSARAALRAGDVDSRLLIMIAALSVQQPVRITAFDDPSPGADPAVPLRGAEIAPLGTGAHAAAGLRSLLSFINAQRQPFLPLKAIPAGTSALTVVYAAPSPLGLIRAP